MDGEQWQEQIAALTIQLAYRQYCRRKMANRATRRQRVVHPWSPTVIAGQQRERVRSVYGTRQPFVQYEPHRRRPTDRPEYFKVIPSPAATSFQFALASYSPVGTRTRGPRTPGSTMRIGSDTQRTTIPPI